MKRRRIIYNNDGGDLFLPGADTPEGFLSKRLALGPDSQVDSVFYCTGATTIFTHRARVGEMYGEFVGHCPPESLVTWTGLKRNLDVFQRNGHDVLNLVIDHCRKTAREIFWTYRINDIHDSMDSCSPELSRWKRAHPEYCLGPAESVHKYDMNSPRYWWSALDFEKPEVLEYLFRIAEDVCRRYDIDGIEIDYFRSPMFFKPNLDFEPVTEKQVEILTQFQQRIRAMARQEGRRRGREILMATRVPMTEGTCRHVGIDVVRWLEEDLLDVLTTGGGYVPFTMPTRAMVDLGHRYGKPVYPAISDSGLRNQYKSAAAWYGAATNALRAGADGVYTFNLWPNKQECPNVDLSELEDRMGLLETLARVDKVFAIDNFPILEGDLVQAIEYFQMLPVYLESWGRPQTLILVIGDDIASAAGQGVLKEAKLRVQLENLLPADRLEIRLNGQAIPPVSAVDGEGWLIYEPDPSLYRLGNNEVCIRLVKRTPEAKSPVMVKAVEVPVKYR